MAFHQTGPDAIANVQTMNDVQGNQNNYYNHARDLSTLAERLDPVFEAAFDRGGDRASRCMQGTRVDVLDKVKNWIKGDPKDPICWVRAAAGFGKSAIARSTAEWCAAQGILGSSFFFLRGSGKQSKIAGLMPTLAYYLSQSVPATKSLIEKRLKKEPDILRRSAAYQFERLLVDPFLNANKTVLSYLPFSFSNPIAVIIVDALDECDDKALIAEFLKAVITAGESWPFRILFTSRMEEHIRQILQSRAGCAVTLSLSLHDFSADKDIHEFYRTVFADIHDRNQRVSMRGVTWPWPSEPDLHLLITNTAGVFNFASTVVAFVDDGSDPPHLQLTKALRQHDGLDTVYTQILSFAARNKDFEAVLGTLMLLANPLPIRSLATLLQLDPAGVLHALKGLQSILIIPEGDDLPIRPIHASLRDFLMSAERSGNLFIHPTERHLDITFKCLHTLLISSGYLGFEAPIGSAQHYACHNWILHSCSVMKTGLLDDSLIPLLIDFASRNFDIWVNTILRSRADLRIIYGQIDALVSCEPRYLACGVIYKPS